MKRIATLFAFLVTSASVLFAQNLSVKGLVYDYDLAEPLFPANVQIYQISGSDSTFIGGASTEDDGSFVVNNLKAGNYRARVTFVGYDDAVKNFTLRSGSATTDLGKITLRGGQMLEEVAISAVVQKVQLINDTVMFNSAAFKLPEGSSVEDLIRKLPGVQIGSDGDITVNGKSVSRILVNGKEFFDNDKTMALTQLTADMIERVKSYEKQSDLARQTGIEDGNEETVLDLQVKKGMAKGWFGNLQVGWGAPLEKEGYDVANLYRVQASVNRFDEDKQFTITGSASQSSGGMSGMGGGMGMMRMGGGIGFGGGGFGGGGMGGGGGVSTSFNGGANFAMNLGKEITSDNYQYEVGGSVNWSHSDNTNESKNYTKDFSRKDMQTFSNQAGGNGSGSNSLSGQMRIEWNKDNYTSLLFTPQFSYSSSDSWNANKRYQFVKDPYQYTNDPLNGDSSSMYNRSNYPYNDYPDVDPDGTFLDSLYQYYNEALQNMVLSSSSSETKSYSTSGNAQFVRRFGNRGRNISLSGNYNIQRSESEQLSHADNTTSSYTNTSTKLKTIQNRYTTSPSDQNSFSAQMTYSEPIATGTYLQFSYQFSYSERNEDRSTYNLAKAYDTYWGNFTDPFDDINWAFDKDSVTRDDRQSTKSFNYNYDQNIQLQFRKNATDQTYNFTVGITLMPQYTKQPYNGMGIDTTLERWVTNFQPTLQFRYRITRQEQFNIQYRGRSSQPQMSQLLPITDDRSLTRITKGNPSLVPYYTNNLNITYQKYNPVTMGNFNVNASLQNTLRSVTTKTTIINDIYGAQMTQPFNLDGFWSNWSGNLGLNTSFTFPDDRYSFTTSTQGGYTHQEGLTSTASSKDEAVAISDDQVLRGGSDPNEHRSNSNSITARENLSFEYRDDYLTASLDGSLSYRHSENDQAAQSIKDTYDFSYGASFMAYIPWRNMRIGSDLNMNSRRGYDGDANTDELIWNASLSFSFLKGNKASLSIAAYDLLHQRSNMSYNVGATSVSQSQSKNITSYFMATLTYRLTLMGDRNSRQQLRGRGGMGGFGGGMGGFGGGMGGFGGGMGGFGGGMGGGMMF